MLVPTRQTKILPVDEAPHHTTNAMSLVINTVPSRILDPSIYNPLPSSTDQVPQVIKRNSIVPPHSGLNSSWPPSLISNTSPVSSLRTSPAMQSFCPPTTSAVSARPSIAVDQNYTSDIAVHLPGSEISENDAMAVDQRGVSHLTTIEHEQEAVSETSDVADICDSDITEVCEQDVRNVLKNKEGSESVVAASDAEISSVDLKTSNLTLKSEEKNEQGEVYNDEKEAHLAMKEVLKKFNTKFRGKNLQMPPENEKTQR